MRQVKISAGSPLTQFLMENFSVQELGELVIDLNESLGSDEFTSSMIAYFELYEMPSPEEDSGEGTLLS